jgi:protein-tyrosine phosphatase
MQQEAKKFGYDLSSQIARQFSIDDFYSFDYIVAMDESNLYDIKEAAPIDHNVSVDLMLNYAKNSSIKDVPDPYYGGDSGFTDVINILEDALDNFIDSLEKKHNLI